MCSQTGLVLNFFIAATFIGIALCSGSSRRFTCTPTQWELENSPVFAANGIIASLYKTLNITQTNGVITQSFISHRCYWNDDGGLWKRCDELCQHVSKIRECQSMCPVMYKCLYGAAEDGFIEICAGTMSPVFPEFAPPTPSPPVCAHPVSCKNIETNTSQYEVTDKTLHSLDSTNHALIAAVAFLGVATIVLLSVVTWILCRRLSCSRHSPENERNAEQGAGQQDQPLTAVETADSALSSMLSTDSMEVTE